MKSKINFNTIAMLISGVLVSILLLRFATSSEYALFDQDEIPYYEGAQVFASSNSVMARSTIAESVSPVFQADWYGIFYPIFFGGIMKIIGINFSSFIFINIALFSIIILLILKTKLLEKEERMALLAITLASPVLLYYLFYFMPMVLNVFFALVLSLLLLKINKSYLEKNETLLSKNILIYCFVLLLISLFRVTYVFWVIGIIPFATNRIKLVLVSFLSVISIALIMVYMKYCTAPAYAENMSVMNYLFRLDFYNFITGVFTIIKNNVVNGPLNFESVEKTFLLPYYFTLIAPIFFVIRYAFFKKNKLLLSISLICLLSNLVSASFYLLTCYYYMRLSISLFFVLCFIFILDKTIHGFFKQVFVALLLVSSYFVFDKSLTEFRKREQCSINIKKDFFISLSQIKEIIEPKPSTFILYDKKFLYNYLTEEFLLSVPYYTEQKNTIHYTVNIKENDPLTLHNKLKIDYILTMDSIEKYNAKEVFSNQYYHLYKLN